MYTLAVQRDFTASHFLIGGDWGLENDLHPHDYRVQVRLEGLELDHHGYLVDIVEVERALDDLVSRYRDGVLNEMEEFAGLNPSIEHFCRIFCRAFSAQIRAMNISAIAVRIWENEIAWAEYRLERA